MHITEEANLLNCEVAVDRSDNRRVHVNGRNGAQFVVKAYFARLPVTE